MTALVRSEVLKLVTLPRTAAALVLAVLVVSALGTAATVDSALDSLRVPPTVLRDVVSGAAAGATFFALVLGILVATWEYRHGTASHTFLAAPMRGRVLAAKTVTVVLAAAALVVLAIAAALAIALPWLAASAVPPRTVDAGVWTDAARGVAASALFGALGLAVGTTLRSQSGAIAAGLLWFLVAEPLVRAASKKVGHYLPGAVVDSLLAGEDAPLSQARGAIVAAAYALALAAVAVLATRRDVT